MSAKVLLSRMLVVLCGGVLPLVLPAENMVEFQGGRDISGGVETNFVYGGKSYTSGTVTLVYDAHLVIVVRPNPDNDGQSAGEAVIFKRDGIDFLFHLKNQSKLTIIGTEDCPIVLDGNSVLDARSNDNHGSVSVSRPGTMIYSEGNNEPNGVKSAITLENCTIRNCYRNMSYACGIHMKDGRLSMSDCVVSNCLNYSDNSIIYGYGRWSEGQRIWVSCTNCVFANNACDSMYAGVIKAGGAEVACDMNFKDCFFTNNYSSGWGGAILWAANSDGCKMRLNDCRFIGNEAQYLGGAVSNEAQMDVSNCLFVANRAMAGGAISSIPFTLSDTYGEGAKNACGLNLLAGNVISNNIATATGIWRPEKIGLGNEYPGGGGGIWLNANNDRWSFDSTIGQGNVIVANTACNYGGGVALFHPTGGGEASMTVDGGMIIDNVATNSGGGLYMTKADMTLKNGVISGNRSAKSGGGVAIELANKADLEGGDLANNTAQEDGGGIYVKSCSVSLKGSVNIVGNHADRNGGASYTDEGTLTLEGGNVMTNTAVGNGGGFYARCSDVSLTGKVSVKGNHAGGNGGGLAVVFANEPGGSSLKTLKLRDGSVESNVADGNGGGFWISRRGSTGSEITGAIEVYGNEAKNGGGVYLDSEAYFQVTGGFIYGNKAVGNPAAAFRTAYNGGNETGNPEGVGGGFYLAKGTDRYRTTLSFSLANGQDIGVFANRADCAADDVAAEGVCAQIQNMPDVKDMVLNKLAGAIVTGWDEDYRTNDMCYAKGTCEKKEEPDYQAERYRTVIARGDPPIKANALHFGTDSVNGMYMCLTLGYIFPIPERLWITDHQDLGNGVVDLQFRPCFSNENDKAFSISEWARAAEEGRHLWVVWGDTEANTIANCTKEKLDENAMTVKLRKYEAIDEDAKTVWVTTPFFTNWTHEASSGTNRFYKIVVDDLSEDILKDRAQASE